ncbi:hypothetical protein PpBr36_07309 [Pyricularia pennisetigena]|uniref:hypothetical protein n=1 Tax=Pyricularia pennisetigena TaxID=1578925 RepID=UPI001154832C|nr:hypothetical protein PpBr36_07309 [Pyricularia pennisetigena]TLS25589.1 hypothetical protein PpBr36_07309 [Pyricularia pennisetigena]
MMMSPLAAMRSGVNALTMAMTPKTLVSNIQRTSSRSMSVAGITIEPPLSTCRGVAVVRVRGERVADEQRAGQGPGLGDLDGRARLAEVLGEGLAGPDGGERAGGRAVVGERLDVDGLLALVAHDGLLGRDASDEGDGRDGGGELHFGGW